MDNQVLVVLQELQLGGQGVDADVDFAVLQSHNAGGSLQQGLEDDLVSNAGSVHALGIGAPVVLVLDEGSALAFNPGLQLVLTGTDQPGLLVVGVSVSVLGLDDHGLGGQGGHQIVGVGGGLDDEGQIVTGLNAGQQTQGAGGVGLGAHSHFVGEDAVLSGTGGAVAELDTLVQVEHQGVVIFPLPALGDHGTVNGAGSSLLSRVLQVDQALVGQGDGVVVDLVVLHLGIQVVDVLSSADGQSVGLFLAAAGNQAEDHDDSQKQRKQFLHFGYSPYNMFLS